jgi:hypothetical protein
MGFNVQYAIKTQFESCNIEELNESLEYYSKKWMVSKDGPLFYIEYFCNCLNINHSNYTYDELYEAYKEEKQSITYLRIRFAEISIENDEMDNEHESKIKKIMEIMHYAEKVLSICCIFNNTHPTNIFGIETFNEFDYSRNSPYQNLLLFLLDEIYRAGYHRYQGNLYEKIYYNGYFTHAWKDKMTIKQFIYDKSRYCTEMEQWHNLTSNPANIRNATDFLENCQDHRICDLVKDRHVFAFKNGLYLCKEKFENSYIDHFYEYGSEEIKNIDIRVVASKFFNTNFDNFDEIDDFYEIPTPYFQSILDYQEFPEDVCRWVYAFVGRLFYDLGELDDWQVALFLEGVARSGKSTFTKIVKKFYETMDVGVLSNNIERKFGLYSLKDKLLFLAPEIKADLGLEQSEFQLLIEGGDMQLPVKFKESQYIRWKTPGLFAGNEPPEYSDNSGSISRRLLVLKFVKKVTNADPDLDRKLEEEIPKLIKKSVSAYLGSINQYSGMDLWKVLPKYFRDTQTDMAISTNSLQHFISSGKVVIGEDYYCREKNFVQAFNEHCRECHLERHKFTSDYYLGIFGNHGITIKKNCKMKYPNNESGRVYQGAFIFGLDLVQEEPDNSGDEF